MVPSFELIARTTMHLQSRARNSGERLRKQGPLCAFFIRNGFRVRIWIFAFRNLFLAAIILGLLGCGACTLSATNSTHWAFQPLRRVVVPSSGHSGAIDALVSSALAKGRRIAPEANRRALLRRLSFDLRGLPPSLEEIETFLKDTRLDAYERQVEQFLASSQYGERWGRHWLDVVGYADSNGYFSADSDRPLAWKFRDYVVRSINADKPLDLFIREQIAGDELVGYIAGGDVTPEMLEPLIATHFWRNAPDGTSESDGNALEVKVDKYAILEGNVQIFASAFLGLTLQCARCHDHKFEPISQEEYYGLQAVLRPAFDPDHWLKPNERVLEIGTRAEREAHQRRTAVVERDLKTLRESLEGLTAPFRKQAVEDNLAPLAPPLREAIQKALDTKEKQRTDAMKSLLKTNAALVDLSTEALEKRFPALAAAGAPLTAAIKTRESEKPPPLERIAVLYEPTNAPPPHHLLIRGNHANEGKEVEPGAPAVFGVAFHRRASVESDRDGSYPRASSGRRLALARWLTSPDNPILARMLVNRVWHYHFGQGLVGTIDNLGQSGRRPVHPELLDWLATELIRSGWSLKHIHRLLLNSAIWKQEVNPPPAPSRPGPARPTEDYWSSVAEPRRLDAESLRDAMLAVSGELDLTAGGPYVPTKTDPHGQIVIDEKQNGAMRRSIYLQQRRTYPVNFLSAFDGPTHNPVCVQRVSSTVALQSLTALNSEFVRARARAFARRVLGTADLRPPPDKPEISPSLGSPLPVAAAPGQRGESQPRGEAGAPDKVRKGESGRFLVLAFQLAYGRAPKPDELSAAESFLHEQQSAYAGGTDARERVWTDLCQMLLASNAFLYVD